MLVGRYPFDDPQENMKNTVNRILAAQYDIPPSLNLSAEVKDLLKRTFKTAPDKRIKLSDIKTHPWFVE